MAIKKCKYCGKEFNARGTMEYCKGPHYATCEICGEKFEVDPRHLRKTCSRSCAQQLLRHTMGSMIKKECKICGKIFSPRSSMSRYCEGPHYSECPVCGKQFLIKEVSQLGSCCSQECRTIKRRQTNLDRYGVEVASQTDEVKDKIKQTWEDSAKEKKRQTCLEKYGYENSSQNPQVKEKISATLYGRKRK